jgi:hypothetical protein
MVVAKIAAKRLAQQRVTTPRLAIRLATRLITRLATRLVTRLVIKEPEFELG